MHSETMNAIQYQPNHSPTTYHSMIEDVLKQMHTEWRAGHTDQFFRFKEHLDVLLALYQVQRSQEPPETLVMQTR